jgi:hypothetical protein
LHGVAAHTVFSSVRVFKPTDSKRTFATRPADIGRSRWWLSAIHGTSSLCLIASRAGCRASTRGLPNPHACPGAVSRPVKRHRSKLGSITPWRDVRFGDVAVYFATFEMPLAVWK